MNIRKAKVEDIKEISNILMQVSKLHSDNRQDIFKDKKMSEIIKWSEDILKDNQKIVIVAEYESKICGVAVCKIKTINEHINIKDTKIFSVDELCVDKDYRKKGIGSNLIAEAKRLSEENNCNRLELNCWKFNQDAMKFYKDIGFEEQRIFFEMKV